MYRHSARVVCQCVERVDKDKHADENASADQTITGRPVSGQPTVCSLSSKKWTLTSEFLDCHMQL